MITRFYVDNYKCLQNFEYKPKKFELVVGANGTGKSSVFEALDKVRQFVTRVAPAKELFPWESRTKWGGRGKQVFEVDFEIASKPYSYRLEINLYSSYRVEKETLKSGEKIIFDTVWEPRPVENNPFIEDEDFNDEEHTNEVRVRKNGGDADIPGIPLSDPNEPAISPVSILPFSRLHYVKINPPEMTSQVKRAEPRPLHNLSNYASYYLYTLQQKQGKMFEMIPHLREVIDNFDSFSVEEDFEEGRRELRVVCRHANKRAATSLKYKFEELSDGQRALIALYTILFCTLEPDSTLVIDEPENYIALRELQPWLMLLQERLEEYGGQVILISHHPEFINMLAPEQGVVFEREEGGPVRIKPWDQGGSPLAPAEIMARGWES